MSRTVSRSSNRVYGLAHVVRIWNLARSTFYAARNSNEVRNQSREVAFTLVRPADADQIIYRVTHFGFGLR